MEEKRYWPFNVLPPEQRSALHQQQIDFLEAAYREGFRPYTYGSDNYCASSSSRVADFVFRGRRNGWEPWLSEEARGVRLGSYYELSLGDSACVCVRPPFCGVAHFALEWLRGRSLESLLTDFVFVGGYPAGIELQTDLARESVCT